jgi:chromosome segregation ATPase
MANFKLSQLQELKNITEEQAQESYIMVVANDDTGKLKNFRIKISELSKFAETGGIIQETLTPDEIAQMISNAIKDHETIKTDEDVIVIPDKIIEVDTTLKDVTSEVESLKETTTEVVKETLEIKSTINTVETTSSQAINKANNAINKVESVESEVTEVKSVINETTSKVETVESEVNEVKTVINETTSKVDSNIIAINNITQEIEILKTSTPTLDCVTEEHADEFFAECFGK